MKTQVQNGPGQERDRRNTLLVGDVMTHLVVTLRVHDSIQEAARRLTSNRISGAPVVDQGYLTGVVSVPDLVGAHMPVTNGSVPFRRADPLVLLLQGLDPSRAYNKMLEM
jgi:CBS-domain-containing membrane protein